MVSAKHKAGREIVKHQTHYVEEEMTGEIKAEFLANANVSIWEVMQSCALSNDDEIAFKSRLNSSTFFNREHHVKILKTHLCRGHGSFRGRTRSMMAFSSVASQCEERGFRAYLVPIRGDDFEITDTLVPARTNF